MEKLSQLVKPFRFGKAHIIFIKMLPLKIPGSKASQISHRQAPPVGLDGKPLFVLQTSSVSSLQQSQGTLLNCPLITSLPFFFCFGLLGL